MPLKKINQMIVLTMNAAILLAALVIGLFLFVTYEAHQNEAIFYFNVLLISMVLLTTITSLVLYRKLLSNLPLKVLETHFMDSFEVTQIEKSYKSLVVDGDQSVELVSFFSNVRNQLDYITEQGNSSVDVLCQRFGRITELINKINKALVVFNEINEKISSEKDKKEFSTHDESLKKIKTFLSKSSKLINKEISASLVEFQFQDRVSQILHHVREALDELGSSLISSDGLISAEEVSRINQNLYESYSMEIERENHRNNNLESVDTSVEVKRSVQKNNIIIFGG
ncbi:hypothetical protein [Marinobacter sp. NSM]|uniref:hypothetical protein n=1 Tax=Marinobacter sp. NSM TaxID=3458004 RepID=UPI0040358ADC